MTLLHRLRLAANRAHAALYARTDGRVGGAVAGRPVLLLETVGRRTGASRRTPVQYVALDGEAGWVVVASNGGSPVPPAWWHNLRAHPAATVQVGAHRAPVRAREATGAEREALAARWSAGSDWLAHHEQAAGRRFPVIVLEPAWE